MDTMDRWPEPIRQFQFKKYHGGLSKYSTSAQSRPDGKLAGETGHGWPIVIMFPVLAYSNNLNSTLHNFYLFAFVNYQVEKPFRRKDLYCTSFYLVFKNILFWPFHGHFWNVLSLKITNNVPSRSADFHTTCYMFPKKVFLKRFKSFFMHFMH